MNTTIIINVLVDLMKIFAILALISLFGMAVDEEKGAIGVANCLFILLALGSIACLFKGSWATVFGFLGLGLDAYAIYYFIF